MRKILSVFLSLVMLFSMVSLTGCKQKVGVQDVLNYVGSGVSVYEFLANAVVPGLSAEKKAELCPILADVKTFWNLGVVGIGAYLENKDPKQGAAITVNLHSFEVAMGKLFDMGVIKEEYKIYYFAILSTSKFLISTLLPNVTITSTETIDVSYLFITFDCNAKETKSLGSRSLVMQNCLMKIDSATAPTEIKTLKDKLNIK